MSLTNDNACCLNYSYVLLKSGFKIGIVYIKEISASFSLIIKMPSSTTYSIKL